MLNPFHMLSKFRYYYCYACVVATAIKSMLECKQNQYENTGFDVRFGVWLFCNFFLSCDWPLQCMTKYSVGCAQGYWNDCHFSWPYFGHELHHPNSLYLQNARSLSNSGNIYELQIKFERLNWAEFQSRCYKYVATSAQKKLKEPPHTRNKSRAKIKAMDARTHSPFSQKPTVGNALFVHVPAICFLSHYISHNVISFLFRFGETQVFLGVRFSKEHEITSGIREIGPWCCCAVFQFIFRSFYSNFHLLWLEWSPIALTWFLCQWIGGCCATILG